VSEAHETYVDWLVEENRTFAAAARLGLDTVVPSCPGWSVRDLVEHHASFQLWITELIVERAQEPVAPSARRPPSGVDVVEWYDAIGDQLVETLRGTDPATPVWSVTGEQRAGSWARRQASETSVHRWDAQNAHGSGRPITHAGDYVSEMLTLLLPNVIRSFGTPVPGGTLALHSTDERCAWAVGPNGPTIEMIPEHGKVDVSLTGSTSDLFLALWGRPTATTIEGDASVLAQWRTAISGG
jgi:uncharacterized protein (TIGR03083 family)